MNAKKLVVAALSASMILTATPAFAKEETKTVKYTAEQQYIINLLEQAVANDKVTVANAKKALEDAKKALEADPSLLAAKLDVEAKKAALDEAKKEVEKLEKAANDSYNEKLGKNAELVKQYASLTTLVSGAKLSADATEASLKYAENKLRGTEGVNTELNDKGEVVKFTDGTTTLSKSEFGKLTAKKDVIIAYFDAQEAAGTAKTTLENYKKQLKDIADKLEGADLSVTQAELERLIALNDKAVYEAKSRVSIAEIQLAAAQKAYEEKAAGSKLAEKVKTAEAALKAAEANLAQHEKELAAAKAGESDKELVVEGTNGKKQVPNTADAE